MTLYVKLENNTPVEYPVSYDQIYTRILSPNNKPKLPIDLDYLQENGYHPVTPQNIPSVSPSTRIEMGLPILANGIFYENYVLTEMTDEEKNISYDSRAFDMRNMRDVIFRETIDRISPVRWESMSSETKESWVSYREDLLNITTQDGFPFDVIWPTQPTS